MWQQVLKWIGIAMILAGALIGMYGGFRRLSERGANEASEGPEVASRARHRVLRRLWLLLAFGGCSLLLIALAA